MSNFTPQTSLDSKDHAMEESKEQFVPNSLSSPTEVLCPPKQDSSESFPDNQTQKEESKINNEEIHPKKLNDPLEESKTANRVFEGISRSLLLFQDRNSEIKEFAQSFQMMENNMEENLPLSLEILNEEIVPKLHKSFQDMPVESKNYEPSKFPNKYGEDETMQNLIKMMKKHWQKNAISKEEKDEKIRKDYARLFETQFQALEEFYKQILHAYTTLGCLKYRVNEYLRTEDWMKLDSLLIFTYCLFKAFQWGPTGLADSFVHLKGQATEGKLTLYRRADFDQGSLDFYSRLEKNQEFSWNGVISTSLEEEQTKGFSGNDPTKKPVFIKIEVNFSGLQPKNLNALYLEKFSYCPKQKEVALAPGSIFELLEIDQQKPEVEMRLKLVTNSRKN